MSARLIDLLLKLAPRERWLLALLVLVALPAALGFGWLLPLSERRAAVEVALQEARAVTGWVSARAADQALLAPAQSSGPSEPIGLSGLEQSLISARLRPLLSELANGSDGGIALRFDAVPFGDLVRWLSASDPGWGYDIVDFRLLRSDDPGIVSAELRLVPQG
ncbi:type II secretion system protein GspM [Puniceibacterium sp. IMCC21224]|uniref:type II secretion system protein GspM n=1 Tax=Puniceibacterium sp. IMCC21224 TaxID=1618204 RepID=UPI00064DFD75|nr:type II secretion system protein GspM [Puniceibacterium sp. IMCC21224]KMK64009.1 type II secretory pathway, component PulM [Puniceibacterium sp. IMCC21224]